MRSQGETTTATHTPDDNDLADQLAQYDYERTAPAQAVSGAAMLSASQQAASLSAEGSSWQEFTTAPFNAQPSNYTARAGSLGPSGVGVWGGLQDNGTSFTASHSLETVEPAGGDGVDVIVDPQNANKHGRRVHGRDHVLLDRRRALVQRRRQPDVRGAEDHRHQAAAGLRSGGAVRHAARPRWPEREHVGHWR